MKIQPLIRILAATLALVLYLPHAEGADGKKLRLICVTSLGEEQEVILASLSEGGQWKAHGKVALRESLISDPLTAKDGELHLAVRKNGKLESICHFTYPADTGMGLVILEANKETKTYAAHFVDPEQAGFAKGSMLMINLSKLDAVVIYGSEEIKVPAGERAMGKPTADENGMFRMQVTRTGESGEAVACFDRYLSANPGARDLLILLPDEASVLRVVKMPIIGDLE